MDTLQTEIYTALQATGERVSYAYPQEGATLPCISFYEAANREFRQVEGREAVTEVEYVVDIWGTTPEGNMAIALSADTQLATLRMKRTFSHDLYETDTRIHHKSMRYRALIHIDRQEIYQ